VRKIAALTIDKLAMGGFGIGFDAGKAVFVPYTVPGDRVDAVVVSERKDVAFARATEFSQRGESYQTPACEAFGGKNPCGGCDWLMLDYTEQLRQKDILLKELFAPRGLDNTLKPMLASPRQQHYRNKSYMPVGAGPDGMRFGIYARWSHRIVPHGNCQVHPGLFDAIAMRATAICQKAGVQPYDERRHSGHLRHIGIRVNRDGSQILVILVTRTGKLPFSNLLVKQLTSEFSAICGIVQNINREPGNVILGTDDKLLYGKPWLLDELGGLRFRVHYRSFWQANPDVAELIMDTLRAAVKPGWTVIDAFSGTGSIGLCLAGKAAQVICVEENSAATVDGEFNAELNGISNVGFIRARVEDALPALLESVSGTEVPDPLALASAGTSTITQAPDCIVLDPPRGGVPREALAAIIKAAPQRVIYLSCSPITLARDLDILAKEGRYAVSSLQPYDMFPQTWHMECLAILDKGE